MAVALVLGAAVWADGPSPTLRRRTMQAAAEFHAGRVDHLIGCGGLGRHPPTEAAAIHHMLLAAQVPADRIRIEDKSTNTLENICFALPILASLGSSDIVIVTDWYHAPRARLIARRLGLRVRSTSPPLAGASLSQQARSALREVPAYLLALCRLQRKTSTST
jgi:uncharacterized SAM-binding protein YcdF (DUF218 family)